MNYISLGLRQLLSSHMKPRLPQQLATSLSLMIVMGILAFSPDVHAADPIAATADDKVVLDLVNQALEKESTGVEVQWSNPATGNGGIIVVIETLSAASEQPCRKYRRTRKRPEASLETIEGVGCRIGPGVWELEEATGSPKNKASDRAANEPAAPQRCPLLDPNMVVHVPCGRPAPFVSFTMPAKASY